MMDLMAQAGPKLGFWGVQPYSAQSIMAIVGVFLLGMGAFFGLMRLPTRARRPVVMTLTFAAGLIYVLWWIWPVPVWTSWVSANAERGTGAPISYVASSGLTIGELAPEL